MQGDLKIVDYYNFCRRCKYWDKGKESEPCDECLESDARVDTRQPKFFEEDGK